MKLSPLRTLDWARRTISPAVMHGFLAGLGLNLAAIALLVMLGDSFYFGQFNDVSNRVWQHLFKLNWSTLSSGLAVAVAILLIVKIYPRLKPVLQGAAFLFAVALGTSLTFAEWASPLGNPFFAGFLFSSAWLLMDWSRRVNAILQIAGLERFCFFAMFFFSWTFNVFGNLLLFVGLNIALHLRGQVAMRKGST